MGQLAWFDLQCNSESFTSWRIEWDRVSWFNFGIPIGIFFLTIERKCTTRRSRRGRLDDGASRREPKISVSYLERRDWTQGWGSGTDFGLPTMSFRLILPLLLTHKPRCWILLHPGILGLGLSHRPYLPRWGGWGRLILAVGCVDATFRTTTEAFSSPTSVCGKMIQFAISTRSSSPDSPG